MSTTSRGRLRRPKGVGHSFLGSASPDSTLNSMQDVLHILLPVVKELFNLMDSLVKGPDLLIYLRASVPTLVEQIQKRGRDYENSIRLDYLTQLNDRYEAWVEEYDNGKLLIIDVDNINFSENEEDLGSIIEKIDAEINGLF